MKQTVEICDSCNDRISKYTCCLCGNSQCEDCSNTLSFDISNGGEVYIRISAVRGINDINLLICETCRIKINTYGKHLQIYTDRTKNNTLKLDYNKDKVEMFREIIKIIETHAKLLAV